MKLLGYGEDALTLWALTRRLDAILSVLGDASDSRLCEVLFRPSFGRSGGTNSAQFGEFDFMVLTRQAILLGESKWDRSSEEINEGVLTLRPEQEARHRIMRFYIDHFAFKNYQQWGEFIAKETPEFSGTGLGKPLAPEGSRLASNLEQVLRSMRSRFQSKPEITDILLYLRGKREKGSLPSKGPGHFRLVPLDYSEDLEGNMISFEI